jgi:cell shape-determining protein MreC
VNTKKALIIIGAALIAFFLISQPVQSASLVNSILSDLRSAAEAVITFVRSVFQG